MVDDMSALKAIRWRDSVASRLAMRRSRAMKPGTTSRASMVTFQLSSSMAVSVVASVKRSEVTVDRVPTACWAPRTSLDRRDSTDPVWV